MPLKVYNSLTKTKEEFKPFNDKNVGMYVCGPTVYSEVHLGNLRTFISFDIIYRYLSLFLGYKVRYVRNITDVGHLENDSDTGEDKISKKAKLENLEPMEIAQKYTNDFHNILNKINCLPPSIEPLATGHIIEQIEFIKKIIKNGYAYEVNGSVYFDIEKYNKKFNYGELSGRNVDDQFEETRELSGVGEKKNQKDFALWKNASKEHIMKWISPWGEGFPGWHLECSAMSQKYLGDKIDIHGGGMDLKFPHHECEMAQNKSVDNSSEVKYWLHSNMLTLNGQKMSKSTGNTLLPKELFSNDNILGREFKPQVVRFFILMSHYRGILDFSKEAILSAEKGFNKLKEGINILMNLVSSEKNDFDVTLWRKKCIEAMNDDFNTAILIANIFEAVKVINSVNDKKMKIDLKNLNLLKRSFKEFCIEILGLCFVEEGNNTRALDGAMDIVISLRQKSREDKDWDTSDFIRDKLKESGIEIKDGENKSSYIVNK